MFPIKVLKITAVFCTSPHVVHLGEPPGPFVRYVIINKSDENDEFLVKPHFLDFQRLLLENSGTKVEIIFLDCPDCVRHAQKLLGIETEKKSDLV